MLRVLLVAVMAGVASPNPPAPFPQGKGEPEGKAQGRPSLGVEGFRHHQLNGHTFTLPAGFTIELVSTPKLVERPVVAAFDHKGRLYVCDSSGSNEPTAVQAQKKPHRVMRLVDTNGDGVFDTSTVFVKNVMFPEGAMWLNGSLLVAAPPHILKFTDTDDDGVADKEEIWFDGKTLTGCANDLHGPYPGPDGWVYWCKGAFAKQEYTLPNGKKWSTRASHIFRALPDGSRVEPVMTGGMDNPVDVAFTPGGERIFTTTFLQHPRDGRRDGLIHAIYGGVYGKDHDPIHEHPWTSPQLMPPMTHMGPAAPAGLHRYESEEFGREYENNLFACQFNMRKVSRHVLVPSGSTFITKDSDFLVSDNIDFHPTDVIEDADGSLLVIDTGGWFKLCCPTSQLVKADVTGAIYRVRKAGAHKIDDPRGTKFDWAKATGDALSERLDDPRPAVRAKAFDVLAGRMRAGDKTLPFLHHLASDGSPRAQLAAVWLLNHSDDPLVRDHLISCILHPSDEARIAALHCVALRREKSAVPGLMHLVSRAPTPKLGPTTPRVARAAAEALGRIGDPRAIRYLISSLDHPENDRALDHSLTFALIEIGDAKATAAGLKHASPRVRRACLAALENIPGAELDAKTVVTELNAKDAALRETAWWVAGRHPEWGEHLAGYFRDAIKAPTGDGSELTDRLVKFAKNAAIQKVMGEAATRPVLRAMARSGLKELPEVWEKAVHAALWSPDPELPREAIAVMRTVPPAEAQFGALVRFAPPRSGLPWSAEFALQVEAARPPSKANPLDVPAVTARAALLRKDAPPVSRAAVVDIFERQFWTADGLVALAAYLGTVNVAEFPRLVGVFAKSTDEKVGRALVKALTDPAVRPLVRTETVKPILDKYPKPVRDEAEKLYALLAESRKGEREKLDKLLASLDKGDIRRGQAVFNGTKGQCIACHKVGYVGGLAGPDLTKIGGIRTDRDLLEAIVFPSASFVRSYEPVRVVTTDGRALNGVLKKDAPDEIILTVAADKEERVSRADVESINPSSVSVMPAGLDQQLTPRELADLIAFLRACK